MILQHPTSNKTKQSQETLNTLLYKNQTLSNNIIQPITLPNISKLNIYNNEKESYSNFTSNLGKYIDNPKPDFLSAFNYLENKQNSVSEELFYSLIDYNNYQYDYQDMKKEFIDEITGISKKYFYQLKNLIEEIRKENKLILGRVNNLNESLQLIRKQNCIQEDTCSYLNNRINKLEENLGISINKRRIQERNSSS